ncbi:hypothetical protein JIN84_05780 [Luteolibacter yonseiensis]|uniref:Uncharacterized protein n=1 Tax=Luteolibacter yonseiensis TaxID=1144680 RepID=A0A934R1C1_9BACT|nr:hypothetical protein [Luteolibacter yonseiensis]MBK1815111.1 hypothetical protein [Luteolibacter yonseiensis]
MNHLDLSLMEHEIKLVFDSLFNESTEIDASGTLDGEFLEMFNQKNYDEIPEVIGNLAAFPFFSLVPEEVGKCYLGGYLIYFVQMIKKSRDDFSATGSPMVCGVEYENLFDFLSRKSVVAWVGSNKSMSYIIRKFLDVVSNTVALQHREEDLIQIAHIRDSIIADV